MEHESHTVAQLLAEVRTLRTRTQELEAADAERRRIAEALREREEHLRLALEASRMGTWDWNILTGKVFWSRTQERIFGVAPGTFEGTIEAFAASVHPDDRAMVGAALNRAIAEKTDYNLEYRIVWPDGTVRWVNARGLAFYDETGQAIHMPGVAMDVSERRQADEERRALERKLLEAQKLESLRLLAGGVAHDFNNFLTTILASASLAMRDVSPEASPFDLLQSVETAAQRAAELTRELSAYVGEEECVIQPLDLNRRIKEMAALLKSAIGKRVRISYQFSPQLPLIEGDASQIGRMLMNLVLNAAEAIGDRPGQITVTTGVRWADRALLATTVLGVDAPEGEYVTLEVADNGSGIAAEALPQIFDPFFSTKMNRNGLGLAVVLGIMRSCRGTIKVESSVGQGTTFTMLFPLAEAQEQREKPESSEMGS
jgi:PAS domain S-box-containing protein